MNTATVRREIETFMARNPGWAGMGASMLRILDAGERDRQARTALRTERDAALALAEERQATIDLAAQVQDFHVGQIHDLRALAERRAGERDRLRDWLNIAKQFVWDEEIVENIDAELAAAPPDGGGHGIAAFAGAWPGNETEETLLATLDFLDGKGPPPGGEDAGGTKDGD